MYDQYDHRQFNLLGAPLGKNQGPRPQVYCVVAKFILGFGPIGRYFRHVGAEDKAINTTLTYHLTRDDWEIKKSVT